MTSAAWSIGEKKNRGRSLQRPGCDNEHERKGSPYYGEQKKRKQHCREKPSKKTGSVVVHVGGDKKHQHTTISQKGRAEDQFTGVGTKKRGNITGSQPEGAKGRPREEDSKSGETINPGESESGEGASGRGGCVSSKAGQIDGGS